MCSLYFPNILLHTLHAFLLFCFYFIFAMTHSMWDLSFWPGIEPMPPAVETQNLNHWTTWKVPILFNLILITNLPLKLSIIIIFLFYLFFKFYFIFKLYNIVLVLPVKYYYIFILLVIIQRCNLFKVLWKPGCRINALSYHINIYVTMPAIRLVYTVLHTRNLSGLKI